MRHLAAMTLVSLLGFGARAQACEIFAGQGPVDRPLNDAFFQIVAAMPDCPRDVVGLRTALRAEGGVLATTMVANRGFHNPGLGSFSFFETVRVATPRTLARPVWDDELMFGHFTAPGAGNQLSLDQSDDNGTLMVELLAWDQAKELYNFYELIGQGGHSQWFYRGDSADIWQDTSRLHLTVGGGNPFGNRLRCSGCHLAGGPIMKELAPPHDSWWLSERPLPLGGRQPDAGVASVMQTLVPAGHLAAVVKSGLAKLMNGRPFTARARQSPRQALRPLFCPEELNLESAPEAFDGGAVSFTLPAGFFADPRLAAGPAPRPEADQYRSALQTFNSAFPETARADADHAWLAPVKAWSDRAAVDRLVGLGLIDPEFVADVLAVDLTRPVFSSVRCGLLRAVPAQWSPDWREEFNQGLAASALPGAADLLHNLTDGDQTSVHHAAEAAEFVTRCGDRAGEQAGVRDLVGYLGQARAEIQASEISRNPRGQILEPGFRVIFPVFDPRPRPFVLTLDRTCVPR